MLDLRDEVRNSNHSLADGVMLRRVRSDGEQPIVALGLPILGLLGFDDTDETRRHDAPRKHRRIHQHDHVKGVTIVSTSGRDATEVEGKYGA